MRVLGVAALAIGLLAAGTTRAFAQGAHRSERAGELRARGDAYLAAGDRGSAIGFYRDAIQIDPDDGASYAALGRIYLDRGALADARAAFETGARRAPEHAALWTGLAEVLERMGSIDDAAGALRELTRRTPRDPEAWRARAELARRRGAWSEALAAYRTIVSLEADGVAIEAATIDDARRSALALRLLVGTLDPVRRGSGSAVRRALAR